MWTAQMPWNLKIDINKYINRMHTCCASTYQCATGQTSCPQRSPAWQHWSLSWSMIINYNKPAFNITTLLLSGGSVMLTAVPDRYRSASGGWETTTSVWVKWCVLTLVVYPFPSWTQTSKQTTLAATVGIRDSQQSRRTRLTWVNTGQTQSI